ncbi:MAG: M23 family metallopeptidase [Prevotellaceae bacterium]|nr:M23 family metallopeptidase [Prevotellaceae bacterium]
MAKKFKFNHETLDFDVARRSALSVARSVLLWTFVGALFLAGYYVLFSRFFSTPAERRLERINQTLISSHAQLTKQYQQLQVVVDNLSRRDADIYRRIFESEPPKKSTNDFIDHIAIEHTDNTLLTQQTKAGIDQLSKMVAEQSAFLRQIVAQNAKNSTLQSLPSIQPVQNNDLRRTAATYGMRMHPFYKVLKMHPGMDFTAPLGDKVFATANARVESVENNLRAGGLIVTLNHGNGYKTSYAHLLKTSVKVGQRVKRGSVIGLVGSSGRSVAPHLHYEVEKNGSKVNPLHYFFQDVTPETYQQLISLAGNKGQPLD